MSIRRNAFLRDSVAGTALWKPDQGAFALVVDAATGVCNAFLVNDGLALLSFAAPADRPLDPLAGTEAAFAGACTAPDVRDPGAFAGGVARFVVRAVAFAADPGAEPIRPGAVAPRLEPVGDVARAAPLASALPFAVTDADRVAPPAAGGLGFVVAGVTAVAGVLPPGSR